MNNDKLFILTFYMYGTNDELADAVIGAYKDVADAEYVGKKLMFEIGVTVGKLEAADVHMQPFEETIEHLEPNAYKIEHINELNRIREHLICGTSAALDQEGLAYHIAGQLNVDLEIAKMIIKKAAPGFRVSKVSVFNGV